MPPGYDGDFAGQPLSWFHVSPVLSSTSQVALGSRDEQRWTGSQASECARPCRIGRVVSAEAIAYAKFARHKQRQAIAAIKAFRGKVAQRIACFPEWPIAAPPARPERGSTGLVAGRLCAVALIHRAENAGGLLHAIINLFVRRSLEHGWF